MILFGTLRYVLNESWYKTPENQIITFNTKVKTMDRWYGIPVTLESNVTQLHKEAFGDTDYVPSETVKSISQSIVNKTGYTK